MATALKEAENMGMMKPRKGLRATARLKRIATAPARVAMKTGQANVRMAKNLPQTIKRVAKKGFAPGALIGAAAKKVVGGVKSAIRGGLNPTRARRRNYPGKY